MSGSVRSYVSKDTVDQDEKKNSKNAENNMLGPLKEELALEEQGSSDSDEDQPVKQKTSTNKQTKNKK